MRTLGSTLIVATAILAAWFCWRYAWLTRGAWRRNEHGRHLMAFTASVALVCSVWALRIIIGHSPWWFDLLRLATFAAVPAMLVWRISLLERDQARGSSDPAGRPGGTKE